MHVQRIDAKETNRTAAHMRFTVGSLFFLHGLCFASWGSRIPTIQQQLHLSEATLGSILFSIPIGSFISMPLATWLVARFGTKRILLTAIIAYPLMLLILGFSTSIAQLVTALVMFGFASNMVNVALNTHAVAVERILDRNLMAFLHGLWSVAGFVAAFIGAFMIGRGIAPAWHFAMIFGLALLCASLCGRFLTNETMPSQRSRFAWPDKRLLTLGTIAFCSMTCEGTMFDWSGVYFTKVIGAEGYWIGAGYVAFMSTMALTRFFVDGLRTRFGVARVLQASGVTIGAGLLIAILLPYTGTAIVGFLFVGAGTSACVPLVMSEAGKTTRMAPSLAVGTISTIGFLGFLIGPPVIGWIAELSSLRVSFAVIVVMGCLITPLARHLQRGAGAH